MAADRPLQENTFWFLEAIAEHIGSAEYALRCEREGKPSATGAQYHLDAIAKCQQGLWNRLSKMLPDEYRESGN